MMRHRRYGFLGVAILVLGFCLFANSSEAALSFTGTALTQNFDSLPTDKGTGSVGTTPAGWIDDSTSPGAGQFSVPGWYLYHTTSQSEGGANGHQRMRFGPGTNTGAFYAFGAASTDPEKALGDVGASTLVPDGAGNLYFGVRITNNTGITQTSFTVTYDGEQWRDGQSAGAESLLFAYNLGAGTSGGTPEWANPATAFTAVPQLNFTSPVFAGTNSTGTAVDGNGAGKIAGITGSVININWLPGQDLWLRWADAQISGSDDGLAIDNFNFIAPSTFIPLEINSAQSGGSSAGSTWVGGQPPANGNNYHVVAGHTVTIDAPFAGTTLKAETGSAIVIGDAGNGVAIPNLIIATGASLTSTASGDVSIGSPTALGTLQLGSDVSFTINAGPASATCDLCLNADLSGAGNITVNSATGTSVSIPKAGDLLGTITFTGTGDTVKIDGSERIPRLVMSSTGQNKISFLGADADNITFNQPGIIEHATTTASRLQGPSSMTVNAQVTIDLTQGYPNNSTQSEERRFLGSTLAGSGNIIVNGTTTNLTNTDGNITLNEFEYGGTGEPSGAVTNSAYSGTMTFNNYLNAEIRQNMPRAGFVVNNNARLEFGFQVAHPAPTKSLTAGQITVNNGGVLEVGFEQGPVNDSPFFTTSPSKGTGHHVAHLDITSARGRSGGLTLTSGAKLRMQIGGLNADQFDSISATGNVDLGGATLDLLFSPNTTDGTTADAYLPSDGDTFTLINIVPAPVQGDYNSSGTVDNADYDVWRAAFGNASALPAADGNNNGVVDAGDYLVWFKHLGQSSSVTGAITGDITLNLVDPYNSLHFSGDFTVEKIITATSLQVKFHAVTGGGASLAASVPEPSTSALAGMLFAFVAAIRRGRFGRQN